FVTRYEKHPAQVWFNEGSGRLRDSGQALGHGENWRVTLGDLDGDRDLDALLIGTFDTSTSPGVVQPHEVWFNDGKGSFSNSGQRLTDVDGDGDLEAVIVEREGIAIWMNQGKGTFRERARLTRPDTDCRALAMGDLDGDGKIDLFLARFSQCEVWINRGRGEFKRGQFFAENLYSLSVALG